MRGHLALEFQLFDSNIGLHLEEVVRRDDVRVARECLDVDFLVRAFSEVVLLLGIESFVQKPARGKLESELGNRFVADHFSETLKDALLG